MENDKIQILGNWSTTIGTNIYYHGISLKTHKANGEFDSLIGLLPEQAIEIGNELIKHAENYSGEIKDHYCGNKKYIYKNGKKLTK